MDVELLGLLLGGPHRVLELARHQHVHRGIGVEADLGGQRGQGCGIRHVAALGEVGAHQAGLQPGLGRGPVGAQRPLEELVGGEGVDPAGPGPVELEAEVGAGLGHPSLDGLDRRAGAELRLEVLDEVVALGRHVAVELEGPEGHGDVALVPAEPAQRLLEPGLAHVAPGAHDVGPDLDLHSPEPTTSSAPTRRATRTAASTVAAARRRGGRRSSRRAARRPVRRRRPIAARPTAGARRRPGAARTSGGAGVAARRRSWRTGGWPRHGRVGPADAPVSRSALDDGDGRLVAEAVSQHACRLVVQLDREHPGAGCDERRRQGAVPCTQVDHEVARPDAGSLDEPTGFSWFEVVPPGGPRRPCRDHGPAPP